MMNLQQKQTGISFLGFVFIILVLVMVGTLALRLYPLYYERFQLVSAMNAVASRTDAADLTAADVRRYFLRNIEITNIRRFTTKNLKQHLKVLKGKKGQPNQMRLTYESENEFFHELFFILRFDKTMPLGSAPGE